jgi:hypothetical protein
LDSIIKAGCIKSKNQIKEDIYLVTKMKLASKINEGILILGKFKILDKETYDFIKEQIINHKNVTIGVISSKDTRGTKKLRNDMLKEVFNFTDSVNPVEIVNINTNNLKKVFEKLDGKIKNNISKVIYLDSGNSVNSVNSEINESNLSFKKGNNSIIKKSFTEIQPIMEFFNNIEVPDLNAKEEELIENIIFEKYFQKHTPPNIWKMYEEFLNLYKD